MYGVRAFDYVSDRYQAARRPTLRKHGAGFNPLGDPLGEANMSKKHAALLFPFLVLVAWGPGVLAWMMSDPAFLLVHLFDMILVGIVVGSGRDVGFYTIPVTRSMRLENHRYTALRKAREERDVSCECIRLSKEYRERGEDVQADILDAESAYRRRLSERHEGDAEMYGRLMQDEEMRRLTD